ncbi:MAG: hypothetical protein AB7U20_08820 [Planctomycetaceae bacterium]
MWDLICRFAILFTVSVNSPPVVAQEPSGPIAESTRTAEESAPADAVGAKKTPADEQKRQNLATILLLLLVGVCLIGAALITGTMVWAAKLRRLARGLHSGPTQQDALWYLKKPPPADPEPPAGIHPSVRPSPPPGPDGEMTK